MKYYKTRKFKYTFSWYLDEYQPRALDAQLRRSQPACIIVMVMKLVSVCVYKCIYT